MYYTDMSVNNYIALIMIVSHRPDLNAHGLPPLSASWVFNGNSQLAFIYGHVTLFLQLIYSFHDVPAQLLGLLQALHACQKQHDQGIMIAFVPEGQAGGQCITLFNPGSYGENTCSDTWSSPITLSGRSSGLATPPVDMWVCLNRTFVPASGSDIAN